MTQAEFNQFIETTCSATILDADRPFVDQGIDSLGMLTLMVAVEDQLGIELDPEALADGRGSTPSGLLSLIEQSKATV
ncbi:acyl carrier protein [Cutibacterium sp. WCA-380-WT-3A]|uniref:Acyl carrier protein n=1 Tax=Cutibacterium porci TaxID=2605781 RepID=A0A7K0J439_9ACTN|nr:acyl carrier protein [Cutibacterium porci]MSS44608.1 acyl carrier protein [Cutibacterium porci]